MEDDNEASITGLTLGLGIGGGGYGLKQKKVMNNSTVLSLDLNLDDDDHHQGLSLKKRTSSSSSSDEEHNNHHKTNEKRNDEKNHSRKKLRLSKDQSAMLEDSFRLHTTLNQAQKQALAEKLNLKQRQVEVWFQNRRARTKLKQTEVDCEFLRKCCEKLTDENIRLKEEVKELRALKIEPSLFIQVSKAATLTLCSSCEEQMNNTHNEEEKDATVISDVVQNNNHNMESSIEN